MPIDATTHTANGKPEFPQDRGQVAETLMASLGEGYLPTMPSWVLTGQTGGQMMPQLYIVQDIERMLVHPIVRKSLGYFKAGIAGAEFDVTIGGQQLDPEMAKQADPSDVGRFVLEQCQRWWDRGVPYVQGGYDYGWIGLEAIYDQDEDGGPLKWDRLDQFSPRDTYPLTINRNLVGVRVKNIENKGSIDLWTASRDVPAKGLWYAHQPRYQKLWGESQLFGAWLPWRRLATKDAGEQVIDAAVYRVGYKGPKIRFPSDDPQVANQVPGTANDSQGNPRMWNRDIARRMGEQAKAGGTIGLPSTVYQDTSIYKWDMEWDQTVVNVSPLIEYAKWLQDQISYGVGVPPELLEASETGSGYSGRQIPLEAFLDTQQRIADAILHLFVEQILRPLVRWNWGPSVKFDVKVKRLVETRAKANEGQPGATQPGQAGTEWQPYQGENGQSGWQSTGGRVNYGAVPPGTEGQAMSLHAGHVTDRIRDIARRILSGQAA